MSLYGSLFTGISGLNAMSAALSATSNNIANVNTIGYKADSAIFSTLLTTNGDPRAFASGGVNANKVQGVSQQGLIQNASSSTDLAISGAGFFTVATTPTPSSTSTQTLYTRSGAFLPDANGFLKNTSGLYLMGWQLDNQGNLPTNRAALVPINLNALTGTAQPTTQMNLHINLQSSNGIAAAYNPGDMATGTVTPDFSRTIQVYDTQGGAQQLEVDFVKTAANQWNYEIQYGGNAANVTAANPIASGVLTFNTDGSLAQINGGVTSPTITIPFNTATSGLNPQNVTINFGSPGQITGVTQFDSPSTLISSGVDGALFGGLTGVQVDDTGKVIAVFDNGVNRSVYQLPLATFQNPNGLTAINGNAYQQSNDSGVPSLVVAKTAGSGAIASSALEASTVDLATEFTNLITTQRAYSASAKIITTADDMLQELMQVKR
ncbi:MAG: flagellar hook protein FlgE [Alphaproteobacteria bacterium]